ncbi:three-Cys-motif partner protein TcmP [Opitutus terrae]|nr:three-Cys-motif partner protein TcmP [Opitutus terrae]
MPKSSGGPQFDWRDWQRGVFPIMEEHSRCKLELLRDYLVLYLQIVLANAQGKATQYVTLIDGFAGGGVYHDGRLGSPLVILRAVEEAAALINIEREKPVSIVPVCYFIDENRGAIECLEHHLRGTEFRDRIGNTIHLRHATFAACVDEIVVGINERHRRGGNRTIFFLDQCGYSEVPAAVVRDLDQKLNGRAEFIINFSIGWFGDFLSNATEASYQSLVDRLGLGGYVDIAQLLRQRTELGGNWRHAVESHIGLGFHHATGIRCFSPFYIEPEDNHRGYWLLHLAQNQRARAAMTSIHWSKANRSKHYGPRGYGILSYKPDLDPTLYINGMSFDDTSRVECQALLAEDYGRLVRDNFQDGITYSALADKTCNETIADGAMLDSALWQLFTDNEVEIQSRTGCPKRSRTLTSTDVIVPKKQLVLSAFGDALIPRRRPRRLGRS